MKKYFFPLLICLSLISSPLSTTQGQTVRKEMKMQEIREPAFAGMFYPEKAEALSRDVNRYLGNVKGQKIEGEMIALVVPHAGYFYSGQVSAHAYKLIEGKHFERVVVIAPSHRAFFSGASLYDRGGYRTPLGIVSVDLELSKKMMEKSKGLQYIPKAHEQEHSLEVQIPFLQTTLKAFNLIPIVMGPSWSYESCSSLASVIAETVKGKNVLLVASSDLSHYHPYAQAVELDRIALSALERLDPGALNESLERGTAEACGGGPLITVLLAAKFLGADKGKVLKYANSGDVTGDRSRVVGYGAAVLYRKSGGTEKMTGEKRVGVDLGLSEEEKRTLHHIARTVIECEATAKPIPEFKIDGPHLKENRGAFVTLNRKGKLRGCIGYIEGHGPLHQTIREMAQAAAFRDPRFPSVTEKEVSELEIEISVLTPLKRVTDINEIEVGTHGIYLKKGWSSGLLLPQVATEYGWDRKAFLENTCYKAGLPPDAWKDKSTEIYVFSADIF